MSEIYYTKRNENLVSLAEDGDKILGIIRDSDSNDDPRTWDNLGKMVCFHFDYNLGDKHEFSTSQGFKEYIEEKNNCVYLPLYLLDHSGITIQTTSFNDSWDSGKVGWIYAKEKTIKKHLKIAEITNEVIDKVKEIFKGEVETYDQYLRGDVYRFSVETKAGKVLDSCGGFFGDNFKENGMKDHLGEYVYLVEKLKEV